VGAGVLLLEIPAFIQRPTRLLLEERIALVLLPIWLPWLLVVSVRLIRGRPFQLLPPIGLLIVAVACLSVGIALALYEPLAGTQAKAVGLLLVAGVGSLVLAWQRTRRHVA
jgi:hypothetical protein